MTPDKYLELQEMNKKFYEVVKNKEEKNYWLSKMMDDEIKYHCENTDPIKIEEPSSSGGSLTLSHQNAEAKMERGFIAYEKISLDNFDSKITATNLSGKPVSFSQFSDETKQKMCDLINQAQKAKREKVFAKNPNLEMFDDGQYIGYKRSAAKIANPDLEVENIMQHANAMQTQPAKQNTEAVEPQAIFDEQNIKPLL